MFDLQVTPIFPIKFRVNWPSFKVKKDKIDFQMAAMAGFPLETIFSYFLSTIHPDTSYQV